MENINECGKLEFVFLLVPYENKHMYYGGYIKLCLFMHKQSLVKKIKMKDLKSARDPNK
jgi:hypothetical protein